jgi:hypothetical protein
MNVENEILSCELTEIDHCIYCGKERLWFTVLDEDGEEDFDYSGGEPITIPDHDDWCWRDTFEVVPTEIMPKHEDGFDFCCEDHYNKWMENCLNKRIELLVESIKADIEQWEK